FRSSDVQVRSTVDGNVRSVAHNGLVAESLSEERFREGLGAAELPVELFLIIPPSKELRTRIQATEVRMTADVIPVGVGHKHGGQRRQPRRIGLKRLIGIFC